MAKLTKKKLIKQLEKKVLLLEDQNITLCSDNQKLQLKINQYASYIAEQGIKHFKTTKVLKKAVALVRQLKAKNNAVYADAKTKFKNDIAAFFDRHKL